MAGTIVKKVGELSPAEKACIASLLGTDICDDQELVVSLVSPGSEVAKNRMQAWKDLLESMDKLGEGFAHVPDDEMEAALDKAMTIARPTYEPIR
jgi:hypothetical protein